MAGLGVGYQGDGENSHYMLHSHDVLSYRDQSIPKKESHVIYTYVKKRQGSPDPGYSPWT